jgi:hypothetical protein
MEDGDGEVVAHLSVRNFHIETFLVFLITHCIALETEST